MKLWNYLPIATPLKLYCRVFASAGADQRRKRLQKKHMTLIEVLIAFFLVVTCIFPLLYPHVFILKEQRAFIDKIELDHQVNLLYGKILERLYLNEIPWSALTEGQNTPIHQSEFTEQIPFQGSYQFQVEQVKSSEDKLSTALLVNLIFSFKNTQDNDSKPLNYSYFLFLIQNLNRHENPEIEDDE